MNSIHSALLVFLFCGLGLANGLFSQDISAQDTLELSKEECETLFLKNNLLILAEDINLSKAEARVVQANVWPNPNISLEQVNLWKPEKQIKGQEIVPPLSNDFGRNQQFAVVIEQTILTAGKRKKLKALKEVGVAKQEQYFKELLRNLKLELRKQLNTLGYYQSLQEIYYQQLESVKQLTQSYKNQVEAGFLQKGDYIRLQATALEIQNDIHEFENKMNGVSHDLKLIMDLPMETHLILEKEPEINQNINLEDSSLLVIAQNNRPDFKLGKLNQEYAEKTLEVERSKRVPNLSIQGEYDRGGGIYTDFVGFGIAMDIPIINQNKGNIKIADLEIKQTQIDQRFIAATVRKEVNLARSQFLKSQQFMQEIDADYENELDTVLAAYTQNFKKKNINLVKYIDFLEAYLENKEIILRAKLNLENNAEQINFAVGTDVIK